MSFRTNMTIAAVVLAAGGALTFTSIYNNSSDQDAAQLRLRPTPTAPPEIFKRDKSQTVSRINGKGTLRYQAEGPSPIYLVIRWSERDVESLPDAQPSSSPNAEKQLNESLADHERRLDAVDRLLDLVVGEIEADDRQLQRVVGVLSEWLTAIERRDSERWKAVRHKILELDLGQTTTKTVSFQPSTSGD